MPGAEGPAAVKEVRLPPCAIRRLGPVRLAVLIDDGTVTCWPLALVKR